MAVVARLFTVVHSLFYIFVGGGMLTLPHLVTAFFYPTNIQPEEGSGDVELLSEHSVDNLNERALGLTLLSWQVLLLAVAYVNDKTWYHFAFLSLAPFHVTMLVLAVLTLHTYNIVLHSILLSLGIVSWLSITNVFSMTRMIPLIGHRFRQSSSEIAMSHSSGSGRQPTVATTVRHVGRGDFGNISGSHA